MWRLCLGLIGLLLLGGCGSTAKPTATNPPTTQSTAITVSAAMSVQDALADIDRRSKGSSSITLKINPGASNALAQQIINGAPADIFFSASREWATAVEKAGRAEKSVELLTNKLVLIVPQGNPAQVKSPEDLLKETVKHVALAGEKVPAGKYGQQALTKLNLFAKLQEQKKLAVGDDVRSALAFVSNLEADAGIVYATDAIVAEGKVEVVYTFDPLLHDQIVYVLVLLKDAPEKEAAQRYFDYLQSPAAITVFERFGFVPLGAP